MPKVSIIVPLYKVEEYMDKCVSSLLRQTLEDIEIILVDDGSPDRCGARAEELAAEDSRIKVLHKENGGLSSARNAGLAVADGEYVAFVDSDDWVDHGMLEALYTRARSADADVAVCNYRRVPEGAADGQEVPVYLALGDETVDLNAVGLQNYFYRYLFPYVHGYEVWNKLYRNEIIRRHSLRFEPNREIFSEDLLFNLYYLCHAAKIVTTGSPYYYYLQREQSLMASPRPELTRQYCRLVEKYEAYARGAGKWRDVSEAVPILFYRLFSFALFSAYQSKFHEDNLLQGIRNVSRTPVFQTHMKQIAFGRAAASYCRASGKGRQARLRMKLFAVLLLMGQYRALEKLVVSRWDRTQPGMLSSIG